MLQGALNQEAAVGATHDVIRKVKEEVGKLAKEILAGPPAKKPAPKEAIDGDSAWHPHL
jgi:hypothetical protein